jgi:hypothetical protein
MLHNRREVTQLVEDDEIGMGKPARDLTSLFLVLFLFENADGFERQEKNANAFAVMLDGFDADRRGDLRLARAGTANQDDVVGVPQELAKVKLADGRLVDRTAPGLPEASLFVSGRRGALFDLRIVARFGIGGRHISNVKRRYGAPGPARTGNPRFRRPILYPIELRARRSRS